MFKNRTYLVRAFYTVQVTKGIAGEDNAYILVKAKNEDSVKRKVVKYLKSINCEYKYHSLIPTI